MSKQYFLQFNKLQIINANALANAYILGVPSLTGFVGYAHVINRHFHQKLEFNKAAKVKGIAPVIRDMQIKESHPKYTNYFSSSDPKKPASTIDEKHAHLYCDLFIELEINDEQTADRIIKPYLQSPEFTKWLVTLPLCGGLVQWPELGVKFLETTEDFRKSLNYLPSDAFFLEDACNLLQELNKDNRDNLDKLLELIRFRRKKKEDLNNEENTQTDNEQENPPRKYHYIPVAIGYHGLEVNPKQRVGARSNQHLYAEPVTGVARARTVGSVRDAYKKGEKPPIFWHYQNDLQNRLFIVRANHQEITS